MHIEITKAADPIRDQLIRAPFSHLILDISRHIPLMINASLTLSGTFVLHPFPSCTFPSYVMFHAVLDKQSN